MNGGVAGENRFKSFVNQNRSTNPVRIRRAHLLGGSVSNLELKRNGITLFDKTLDDQNYSLERFGKVPQVGIYHFDAVKTAKRLLVAWAKHCVAVRLPLGDKIGCSPKARQARRPCKFI